MKSSKKKKVFFFQNFFKTDTKIYSTLNQLTYHLKRMALKTLGPLGAFTSKFFNTEQFPPPWDLFASIKQSLIPKEMVPCLCTRKINGRKPVGNPIIRGRFMPPSPIQRILNLWKPYPAEIWGKLWSRCIREEYAVKSRKNMWWSFYAIFHEAIHNHGFFFILGVFEIIPPNLHNKLNNSRQEVFVRTDISYQQLVRLFPRPRILS